MTLILFLLLTLSVVRGQYMPDGGEPIVPPIDDGAVPCPTSARFKSSLRHSKQQVLLGTEINENCDQALVVPSSMDTKCPGKQCPSQVDTMVDVTRRLTLMRTALDGPGGGEHFEAAFGTADIATVQGKVDSMIGGKFITWNCYVGYDRDAQEIITDCEGAWPFVSAMVMTKANGYGTKKLMIGNTFYSQTLAFKTSILIHEAAHAFAEALDAFDGDPRAGYQD